MLSLQNTTSMHPGDPQAQPRRTAQLPNSIRSFFLLGMVGLVWGVDIPQALSQVPAPVLADAQEAMKPAQNLSGLEQRLLELEQRQQTLMEEIEFLKAQLAEQEEVAAAEMEHPGEEQGKQQQPILRPSQRPQGLMLTAETLVLKPTVSGGIDFAIVDPGDALAVSGDLATLDYHNATDVRYGVGYRKGNVDIQARLLSIDSEANSAVERPEGGFLFTTLTHPSQNDSAETAAAQTTLEYRTADLEVGYALQASQNFDLRLFAGLRFADTDQDFALAYDGQDFTETEVQIQRDFAGFGPRIGGDVQWLMGSGFRAFGRAAGSLLLGDGRSQYRETDNSGQDLVAALDRSNRGQIIPVAELALGLGWAGRLSDQLGLNLDLGYEYQNWFNAYHSQTFVDDSSPGVLSARSGDLSFQGFFVKTGFSLEF